VEIDPVNNDRPFRYENPRGIDLNQPYLYFIRVRSGRMEYRYVGKGSDPGRMDAYARNVTRVLAGQTKRPPVKRNGEPQREGNLKYRYVHLILAEAVRRGWEIEHYPLENCSRADHTRLERLRRQELGCNMNDGPSWHVRDLERLARALL
jgi:hypothetical protein